MIRLGANISALQAQRRLADSSRVESSALERLSTGKRINRASDDAAGLSISTQLGASARVINRGILNLNDGVSYFNIAQGATEALGNISIRLGELAAGAANGTVNLSQRLGSQREANQLVAEFNRIVETTKFGDARIIGAQALALRLQGGAGIDGGISFSVGAGLERTAGTGTFTALSTTYGYGGGSNTDALLVDFNGDGLLDMAVRNDSSSGLAVRLGRGDGTFGDIVATSITSGRELTSGDFNGDGKTDIVSIAVSGGSVYFHQGNGDGTFATATTLASSSFNLGSVDRNTAVADFNGDGIDDVAYGSTTGVQFLFGSRSGSFTSQTLATAGQILSLAVGDLNGDGRVDLVTGSNTGSVNSTIYQNNGAANFSAIQAIASVGNNGVFITDLENDGTLELITGANAGAAYGIYRNNGSGTFTLASTIAALAGLILQTVTDLDGDGLKDDFVTGNHTNFTIFTQDDFGNLTQRSTVNVGSFGLFELGDLNGDGIRDILGLPGSNTVQVQLQNTTTTTSAAYLDLTTAAGARSALDAMQAQVARITKELGNIGSAQSRLAAAISAYRSIALETEAAKNRIESADIATESAALTSSQILKQVGAAVLAQANQAPALALRLLQG